LFFLLQLLRSPRVISEFRRINLSDVEPKEDIIYSSTTEISAFSFKEKKKSLFLLQIFQGIYYPRYKDG